MKSKKLLLLLAVAALVLGLAGAVWADQKDRIDYLAEAISPAANFDGNSNNFSLISSVAGGAEIDFNLTSSITTQGSTTTYPQIITFGVKSTTGPAVPTTYFGAAGTATSYTVTFNKATDSFTPQVRVIAPADDGDYSVTIGVTNGGGGSHGLLNGGVVVVHFTVSNITAPPCNPVATSLSLTLTPSCVVYHATSTTFTATLTRTSDGAPLAGQLINFAVENDNVGSAATNANGVATLTYNPNALSVGDYTVHASFQGQSCAYEAKGTSATLGVIYNFLGYQPPVQIQGGGIGLFSGKVIPVKIRIADAFGNPVPDAAAYVFFGGTLADVQTDVADALANTNGDSGNLMRYDPLADQYIFNWDVSKVANGQYNIRIDLGEGTCAGGRLATVAIKKSGGKK